ncbi:DUF4955 domain-containing protein [Pedobacter cryophilus]|uniref:DUF4955 domain-containing protein n=1 Tax=Pedobacter cryophilus TaxID=2571271 RepID=A0A4U1C1E5_9SPHI|nr:DUF4955 domain-containing protein [Pedobacter cryophilus]TKB96877.1 DUF4955 domain-containing protein [Pedobacter cryophilus]
MIKYLLLCITSFFVVFTQAQTVINSTLYADYNIDKTTSILPDFSYVGYHNGNDAIPTVNHTVFNVTNYGAIADDNLSDRAAIEAAIAAARTNGSGIIFFPPGRFRINEVGDSDTQSILINGSNIVFRGSGSGPGGTELFISRTMQPTDPDVLYSTVKMFNTTSAGSNALAGTITTAANIGDFNITLTSKGALAVGDRIILTMLSTDPALLTYEIGTKATSSSWDITTRGVEVKVYHRIKSISGNTLTLYEPITYPINPTHNWSVSRFAAISEIGFEDIAFVGNWKTSFVHHRSWQDDSGYSMMNLSRVFDSWIRRCRFTDVNVALVISSGGNITVQDCEVTGTGGHEAILNNGATNVLISNVEDKAGQWHSVGVAETSMNTVLYNVTYPSTTSFECHASQPRNTLLDNVTGGLLTNRGGGATGNLPNHLRNFIFWNFTQTNTAASNFTFWPSSVSASSIRIPNPIIVGFKSSSGTPTFTSSTIHPNSEAIGASVYPESLYQAQLNLRLSENNNQIFPNEPWATKTDWSYSFGTQTGTFTNTVGTTGVSSLTNSTNTGFLPLATNANTGVYIRSSGNMMFSLTGAQGLNINTSTAGTLSRYSAYDINSATPVAKFSFDIDFSASGLADAGNYVFAVGNNKNKLFTHAFSGSVFRSNDEVFMAMRFLPNTSASSTAINLEYRVGSDASTTTTHTTLSSTTFVKGGSYHVDVYCNNSGVSKTYTKGTIVYTLPNNTFHLWVNSVKVGGDFPRSIEVDGAAGLSAGNSIALSNGSPLNSFQFASNNGNVNSSGNITLKAPSITYLVENTTPVSLVSFDAYRYANTTRLNWSTASESNNKHFELYRAVNDNNFSLIAKVDGAGNSTERRFYSYTDPEKYAGTGYYKLKQVDFDGTSELFDIIRSVRSEIAEKDLTLYEANNYIYGSYLAKKEGTAKLAVYDMTGRVLFNADVQLIEGLNKIEVLLISLQKGVYIAVFSDGTTIEKLKFVK